MDGLWYDLCSCVVRFLQAHLRHRAQALLAKGAAAAQRIFAAETPVAFLYHARGLQGMNRRLLGVRMDLRGELPTVHDWSVTEEPR
jgi:peptide/nickel transport system substrate-binding protein